MKKQQEIKNILSTLFPLLSDDDLSYLEDHANLLTLKKGQNLFRAGDSPKAIYGVAHGYLKVIRETYNGESVITQIVKAGQTLGTRELFGDFNYYRSAIALKACEVLSIDKSAIFNLARKNFTFVSQFMKHFCEELNRLDKRIEADLYMPAKGRIAAIIYELYQHSGESETRTFESPLTRRDIAELADVTPETVSRVLSEFKQSGLLKTKGSQFTLLDLTALHPFIQVQTD